MIKDVMERLVLVNVLRRTAMREILGELHWGQEPILEFLITNGPSSQKQLAEHLHVTPASIALSTKRMEKSGLITKTADSTNLRRNILSITEEGKQKFQTVKKGKDELEYKMFQNFSQEELKEMERLYEKIIFNLTGEAKDINHEVFLHYVNKLKELDWKNKEKKRGKSKK